MGRTLLFILLLSTSGLSINAQPGPIKNLRYEDDFSYLNNDTVAKKGIQKLKYIPISVNGKQHLSFGGELREWYELRRNVNFGDLPPGVVDDPNGVLLHRLMLHADYWAGNRFRIFGQLNNTFEIGSSNEPIPEISQDAIGIHQLFTEIHLGPKEKTNKFLVRLGRQEFNFGNELLISSREGPNNRQTFDGASLVFQTADISTHIIGATPVIIYPHAFDNKHIDEYIWGTYSYFRKRKDIKIDAYYMGFKSNRRMYNHIEGIQTRHTVGARVWKYSRTIRIDIESMVQFGNFNDESISAFNFTGEVAYIFPKLKLKPTVGLGGSYITGDQKPNDQKLNTYDPMYPKPTFGLAAPLGPSNMTSIRPIVGIQPVQSMFMNFSVYFLARQSSNDGTYTPDMTQVRPFPPFESDKKKIGTQYALDIFYIPSPNFTFLSFITYVKPGDYVLETGEGKPIFYFAISGAYKF